VVTAPDQIRNQLERLPAKARVKTCAGFRPGTANTTIRYAKAALRSLARRYQTLTAEIEELTTQINRLCTKANPALLATDGVGADTAATLLVTAGDATMAESAPSGENRHSPPCWPAGRGTPGTCHNHNWAQTRLNWYCPGTSFSVASMA